MAERATMPRPLHTGSPIVNALSRMICQWRENPTHAFLGLAPIGGDYTAWGLEIDGEYVAATHLFLSDIVWGDDPYDTEETSMERPWVVMFLGVEDRSFYRRFATEEEAIEHFESLDFVHFDGAGTFRYAS